MTAPVLPVKKERSAHKAELLLEQALQLQASHMKDSKKITSKSQSELIKLIRQAHDIVKQLDT
jgi:ribonuclease HII